MHTRPYAHKVDAGSTHAINNLVPEKHDTGSENPTATMHNMGLIDMCWSCK